MEWLKDHNYKCAAVIAEGKAPEEILHLLFLLRSRAELRDAIVELRYLLRNSRKGGKRSNSTPGSRKMPAAQQPLQRQVVCAATSHAAPEATGPLTATGTERPLPSLCSAAASKFSYTSNVIRLRKRGNTAPAETQPQMAFV
ncbi:hypothetical protein CVIRNUC_000382 [Coccomyxa viridis]|uniref:Uncharacterized protein n=1 Tax=Coccomyxa viridis TaxID=1274662 RepID=A0AAV1HQJ3_9CHLO|nr:hypothetical protein CVIRNUC_000382 [Coccomyxa viridis]